MIETILNVLYLTIVTTVVWFIIGAIVYMNPLVKGVYTEYGNHPSMKKWSSQTDYLLGVFFIAGFIPILLISAVYQYITPVNWIIFGLILFGIRIIPRFCDMWMQTSYPDKLLVVELVNGLILSIVISFMLSIL